jgi:choline dehydrogenase-like flavoprotein
MNDINGHLMRVPFPGCESFLFGSDEYFECFARHSTMTAYKYSGTAPMGRSVNDPDAVVDSNLRLDQ